MLLNMTLANILYALDCGFKMSKRARTIGFIQELVFCQILIFPF